MGAVFGTIDNSTDSNSELSLERVKKLLDPHKSDPIVANEFPKIINKETYDWFIEYEKKRISLAEYDYNERIQSMVANKETLQSKLKECIYSIENDSSNEKKNVILKYERSLNELNQKLDEMTKKSREYEMVEETLNEFLDHTFKGEKGSEEENVLETEYEKMIKINLKIYKVYFALVQWNRVREKNEKPDKEKEVKVITNLSQEQLLAARMNLIAATTAYQNDLPFVHRQILQGTEELEKNIIAYSKEDEGLYEVIGNSLVNLKNRIKTLAQLLNGAIDKNIIGRVQQARKKKEELSDSLRTIRIKIMKETIETENNIQLELPDKLNVKQKPEKIVDPGNDVTPIITPSKNEENINPDNIIGGMEEDIPIMVDKEIFDDEILELDEEYELTRNMLENKYRAEEKLENTLRDRLSKRKKHSPTVCPATIEE
ncbi:hypothetical protein SNEBB_008637 [Seison nebaliae]|nr:hypothetical protein SNEBB_008637 [Seison nebaliae]